MAERRRRWVARERCAVNASKSDSSRPGTVSWAARKRTIIMARGDRE